jgi:hypothetical protein
MIKINKKLNKLHPLFVTGFADAESSFVILINKNSKYKMGYSIQASFAIKLHKKDRVLLEKIVSYFGVGNISIGGVDSLSYRVTSLKDLTGTIIPHFDKYPLISKKRADYELFKQIVELMNSKEHLTPAGFQKCLAIKASINLGLSDELNSGFSAEGNVSPISRPLVQLPEKFDPYWVAGFVSGEGCFYVRIRKSETFKLGTRVELVFTVVQHSRDEELLKALIRVFDCGKYALRKNKLAGDFIVDKFSDIQTKILQFFDKYNIEGVKAMDYADFQKAAEIVQVKGHLTKEGLKAICQLKAGMNTGRSS